VVNSTNITRLLDLVKSTRETHVSKFLPARIKLTPANTISSRSHLFLTFSVVGAGHLTIVDMAGRESAEEILKASDPKLANVTDEELAEKVRAIQHARSTHPYRELIRESKCIKDSLGALVSFLQKQCTSGPTNHAASTTIKKSHVQAEPGALMQVLMAYLKNLKPSQKADKTRPAKFVMLCTVRQQYEEEVAKAQAAKVWSKENGVLKMTCTENFNSLVFAQTLTHSV
jgi:hypothetical protein